MSLYNFYGNVFYFLVQNLYQTGKMPGQDGVLFFLLILQILWIIQNATGYPVAFCVLNDIN